MRYFSIIFLLVLLPQFRRSEEKGKFETLSWTPPPSSASENPPADYSNVTIAVMGATGSGKTSFVNLASGSNLPVGRGVKSCTSTIQVSQSFELEGRSITLIDTPGFDDTTMSDADILLMIATFLATAYKNGEKLAGLIYIHRISDFRMTGISTRNFKMFRQLCGESTLKNVVVVTNMWGEVSQELGQAREQELAMQDMFFKPVLDKGGQLLRHDNSRESAHNILRRIIHNHPLPLQIQRELINEQKGILETAAGGELNRELLDQIQKHEDDLKATQEEMAELIRIKDEERRRELEMETKKRQDEIDKAQTDAQNQASAYNEEKRRMEQVINELYDDNDNGFFSILGDILDEIFG